MKSLTSDDIAEALSPKKEKRKKELVIQTHPVQWAGTPTSKIDTLYDFHLLQIPKVWAKYGTKGEGVDVFVLDSGIAEHSCFNYHGNFVRKSFVEDMPEVKDGTGHGTWVASKIAGQGVGIAPRCNLHVLQTLDESGTGSSAFSSKALRYVRDYNSKAKIVNMSLGSFQRSLEQEDVLEDLKKEGVMVVCAAGNHNTNQPFYPAASPHALGVAAYDSSTLRAHFSNYGPYIDVSAPGVACYGAYLNGYFRQLSGTSMATPIVCAILTLGMSYILGKTGKRPEYDLLYKALIDTALDLGERGRDPYHGFGGVDALRFMERLSTLL